MGAPSIGQKVNVTLEAMKAAGAEEVAELRSETLASKEAFQVGLEESVNPFAQLRRTEKSIKSHKPRIQKMLQSGEKSARLLPIEMIKDSAKQFEQRNSELKSPSLIALRQLIKPGDTKEEILEKLLKYFPDISLADEALDFLFETTEGELAQQVKAAKDEINEKFGREIQAGRNIGAEARAASTKGLGTPTDMRDLYRDITGNPRDATTLFQELSRLYSFKDLTKVTQFLLHSLGSDMKSQGPSIPRGQLYRLLSETRSIQAILGVYRFFRARMNLVNKLFAKDGLKVPPQLTFETMSKQFMELVGDRYPTSDKVLQQGRKLGIEDWILAKIIAFSQFRDAIREVAANQIYRSLQHRDELYLAILEALEDLEDQLEDLLRKEEEEEGEEEGGQQQQEEDVIEEAEEEK